MKKTFLFIMLSFLCVTYTQAQKMTDDQVIGYVVDAQEKGENQQQIAAGLLRRGVTMEQINRIKRKMNSQETGIGKTLDEKSRTRIATRKTELVEEDIDFLFSDSTMMYMAEGKKKEIFGHRIFQNKEVAFEAAYNLPTPQGYKLGPGDKVAIDVWGASEYSLLEVISPDGNIHIEGIGPVHLSGLTVSQANNYLKTQFGKISSVDGEKPNSEIRLTLAQNRTIQVHVMGEVENPGTYTMSSFATIFNALYQAGGVNEVGTMRAVKVFRNDKLVATYDVYDFILNGNSNAGMRLEDNDVVSVDAYKNLVEITGQVKRPMYYELLDDESVAQLLQYAGGLLGNAYKEDVRLIRNGKREREIYTLNEEEQQSFIIADGDLVSVDSIMPTFANMVEVRGAVYRPGQFQISGRVSTVKQLIECAGGLKDEAFLSRAILNRRTPTNIMENLAINLAQLMEGEIADIPLRKNDVLLVPSILEVQEVQTVDVLGEVIFPGTYEYAENMSIEDLIVSAGGLTEAASTAKVEVARRIKDMRATSDSDTLSYSYSFEISEGLVVTGEPDFTLMPFDQVYVRKSPRSSKQEMMHVEGEVVFPGNYNLVSKKVRLSQIVELAGGLTSSACVENARLERQMSKDDIVRYKESLENQLRIAENREDSLRIQSLLNEGKAYSLVINLKKALEDPNSEYNIVVETGDRLIVPRYNPVVRVYGAVQQENNIVYQEGKRRAKYYVNQAGGFADNARKRKTYVLYADGSMSKVGGMGHGKVKPGCDIYVPTKERREKMTTGEILGIGSTAASLATVVMALVNMLK